MVEGDAMSETARGTWDLSAGVCHWRFDDGSVEDLPVYRNAAGEYGVVVPTRAQIKPCDIKVQFMPSGIVLGED